MEASAARQVIKLTKKALEEVPFGTGWVNIQDNHVAGLKLHVGGQRKTFYIRRRVNGNNRDFKVCGWNTDLSMEQVRKLAKSLSVDIENGILPGKKGDIHGTTFGQAFERYIESRKRGKRPIKPSTEEQYRLSYKTDLQAWEDTPLAEITGDDVEVMHLARSEVSPSRANVASRLLGRVFRFAMEVYRDENRKPIITYNPADRVSTLKLHNRIPRRTGHIPREKLKPWFDAVLSLEPRRGGPDAVSDLFIFTLLTGLRRNEAAQLSWDRVDLKKKSFLIIENKADRPVELPLSGYLHEMLTRRKASAGNRTYVFPAGVKSNYLKHWSHWCEEIGKRSGVAFIPHDLRRTFVTVAESLDLSPYVIKALVNHSLPADDVTGGYIQMDVERLRKPMQKITDFFLCAAKEIEAS